MKNTLFLFLLAIGLTTLFTNCQSDEDLPGEGMLNEPFDVDFEFRTQVTDELSVTFEAITADSRCPCEADCITAGEIGVLIKMTANQKSRSTVFTLDGYDGPEAGVFETAFEGYLIELVDVLPYPCNGEPDQPDDYSVRLIVREE